MRRTTVLAVLERTRSILDQPENWTKGAWERDVEGESCNFRNPEPAALTRSKAKSFCLIGAICRAFLDLTGEMDPYSDEYEGAVAKVAMEIHRTHGVAPAGWHTLVTAWNDEAATSHSDILSILDKCIEDLR